MKILGVVGSPRYHGNTHVLVERILEGARVRSAATECVFLEELTIRECIGCHFCWREDACSRNDDMSRLYGRIAESDAFVFGTPVYWYGPTALMKGFLDRFVYFNCPAHRGQVRNKPVALAVPFEEEHRETSDLTLAIFERSLQYLEMSLAGQLVVPGVTRKGDVLRKSEVLLEAARLGRELVETAARQ